MVQSLTTNMVAPIKMAFVVISDPVGNSILKLSESVKLSAHHPRHFLDISPTGTPPEFSIYNENNSFNCLYNFSSIGLLGN